MESIRHLLALFLVVSLPSLFLYWLLVHPFVNFWRDRGIGFAYTTLLTILTVAMVGLFSLRHFLLSIDYGTNPPLIALGLIFLTLSGWMRFAIHKRLTLKALLGLPEIAPDRFPRSLITDGIYARMRHPRYVQFLIALFGYALITNYLAVYLVTALWVPGIYLIVLLEEKELRDHFGNIYDAYCRVVPRFLPKLRRDHGSDDPRAQNPRRISRMTR
jgi:protein-S-isoprenylcysteine O-methyltransferase Ste14